MRGKSSAAASVALTDFDLCKNETNERTVLEDDPNERMTTHYDILLDIITTYNIGDCFGLLFAVVGNENNESL